MRLLNPQNSRGEVTAGSRRHSGLVYTNSLFLAPMSSGEQANPGSGGGRSFSALKTTIRSMQMQIQVNTDRNVEGREALTREVEAEVQSTLGRFSGQLTRVEVHLSDENAGKSGSADKRCMMEARPTGQQPVAVTHLAASLVEACAGAAQKLAQLLEGKFSRLHDHKGGASIRDNDLR
jgi:hypothetical protein